MSSFRHTVVRCILGCSRIGARFALSCVVLSVPGVVDAAAYRRNDPAAEKRDLIAQLTSNINKVDHTIEVTKALIKQSNDARYLADLYLRLAELYVERSRYVYNRLMEQQPEDAGVLSGEKALEVQITKRLAIELYDKILKEFPEYEHNDQVRFFRAHEFRELGDFDAMLEQYQQLVNAHPKSPWATEARVILGDHHFDKDDLAAAERHYLDVLALPESHVHDMARYKLGWIKINQEKFKSALNLFRDAVVSAKKTRKGAVGDAQKLDVKREALNAMVWPFTEVKKPWQAAKFFRPLAQSKTEYAGVLRRLANRYYIKTQYLSAAILYRELLRIESNLEENIDHVQKVFESVRNLSEKSPKRYANASDDVQSITDTLGRFRNHWKFGDEEKTALDKDFEVRARYLATQLHRQAQKRSDREMAEQAADAYRKYLRVFRGSKENKTMQLNRAEALYQAEAYVDAGLQYEEVARSLENGPERQKLLYEAILAYFKAIDVDSVYRAKHPTKPGLLTRLETLRAREGLKQVGAFYVRTWPKSKRVPTVKFNVARMYYQQGDFERSIELFTKFVEAYPREKDATTAAELAMDALYKLDRYEELAKLGKRFADNQSLPSGLRRRASTVADGARDRKIELTLLIDAENFGEAMLDAWEKHKGTEQGEDVLYAAFVKFKNENNIDGVLDFGGRLIGAYPKGQFLDDVLSTMGNMALRGADFERAAFLFEEFYKRLPKNKAAGGLLLSSARLRFMLGDYERAGKALRIVRSDSNRQIATQAHEFLMQMYRDSEDWVSLAKVSKTAVQAQRDWLAARYHLGLAYLRQGQLDLAERELQSAVRARARSDLDKQVAGKARLALGQIYHSAFDQQQLRDAAEAESVLGAKLQFLERAEAAYVDAIGSGDPEAAIAALYRAAQLYTAFGEFIVGLPAPDGMSSAEQSQYRKALAEQGQPYLTKGAETRRACAKKAPKLKVMSSEAAGCLQNTEAAAVASAGRRNRATLNDVSLEAAAKIRRKLARQPEDVGALLRLATLYVQGEDFHMARLILAKTLEGQKDASTIAAHNLMGVVLWQLGDLQAAHTELQEALKRGDRRAAANIAALYKRFGYLKASARALRKAGDLRSSNLGGVEYHPSVSALLESPES